VVLTLVLCAAFWTGTRPGGPVRLTARFCGYTNDAAGARLAAFRVSNDGGTGVYRWPFYLIEERGRVGPLRRASFNRGAYLGPAQSSIYVVRGSTNAGAWRVVFNFSEESWRRKLTMLPSPVRWLMPSSALTFRVDEAISDWVGLADPSVQDPSAPAAGTRQRFSSVIMFRPPRLRTPTNAASVSGPAKK